MTHKYHLNADLREVLKRLAKKDNATVAQVEEQPIRTRQVGISIISGSSTLKERE